MWYHYHGKIKDVRKVPMESQGFVRMRHYLGKTQNQMALLLSILPNQCRVSSRDGERYDKCRKTDYLSFVFKKSI